LHLGPDDRTQLFAAVAAGLDQLVDRRSELVAGELALSHELHRESVGL